MRAKKNFIVVAYDVSNDRRRSHVVKLLEKVGIRVNYSVFECMLSDSQYEKLRYNIATQIDAREDSVIYYPICLDCYAKIIYQSSRKLKYEKVRVV